MPALFDALAHLELSGPHALDEARASGVTDILTAGVHPETDAAPPQSDTVRVWRARGLHPRAVPSTADACRRALDALFAGDTRAIVAVGECGLDLRPGAAPQDAQRRALDAQAQWAWAHRLPLVLHVVRATGPFLDWLQDAQRRYAPTGAVGMWHGFTGSADTARRAVDLGLSLSVGHMVLSSRATRLQHALPCIPRDRLLIESDAPELSLSRLPEIAAAVATAHGCSTAELLQQTADNARRLYGLGV